jgi:hypothetical protein
MPDETTAPETKVAEKPAPTSPDSMVLGPAMRSPLEALKALQKIATTAAAKAHADASAAEAKAQKLAASKGGPEAHAASEGAHHLRNAAAAFGRAEGGINQALQALGHAADHAAKGSDALKKVTS